MEATSQAPAVAEQSAGLESVIEADSLVEEISIDGMCGVY